MKIGLIAVDSKHPNLALMKISAYHKARKDYVNWYSPFDSYDVVYMSKIFSFTPDFGLCIPNAEKIYKGGTGYDIHSRLPDDMEFCPPDYSIYPTVDRKTAYGFLTRGCPNKCKWCVVPEKEGNIHPYMDVDDVAIDGRTNLILMDNNILACDYGIQQIEKTIKRGYRVDFNQALDARLVSDYIAKLLAKVKWLNVIRFGCDTPRQIEHCEYAMQKIDYYRGKPAQYLLYTMLNSNFDESFQRVNYWKKFKNVRLVAQPFRDPWKPDKVIPQWQKDLARWTMRRELYAKCEFEDFEPRKAFKCKEYFNR